MNTSSTSATREGGGSGDKRMQLMGQDKYTKSVKASSSECVGEGAFVADRGRKSRLHST